MIGRRSSHGILLVVACTAVIMILGCAQGLHEGFRSTPGSALDLFKPNTLFKQYVDMPDGKSPEVEFGDWRLKVCCQAARALNIVGVDTFRVTIETEYMPAVTDTAKARLVNLIAIDSLTIRLLANDSIVMPLLLADSRERVANQPRIYYRHMLGPVFRFEEMIIPDQYGDLQLSYVASVIDRTSGTVLSRQRITHDLHRISEEKFHPTWYSPKSDPKVINEGQ